jgi:hypothetical protein
MFPIIQVDSKDAEDLEPLGTKRKFWFDSRRKLFKAEERGTGDDWAEKIGCELAALLWLPHVYYDLALDIKSGYPGVVCESCSIGYRGLALGNQLLFERDAKYPATQSNKYKVKQHTVDAVATVLAGIQMPPLPWAAHLPAAVTTPLDVFAGYIMLDAWIANQDRHHENWGALRQDSTLYLAPTFDHGASLARNLTDEARKIRLESRDVRQQIPFYARRANSAFYCDSDQKHPMTTLEAWKAFADKTPNGAAVWMDRLRPIDEAAIRAVVDQVPPQRMSGISKDFTVRLLLENQNRILRGDSE